MKEIISSFFFRLKGMAFPSQAKESYSLFDALEVEKDSEWCRENLPRSRHPPALPIEPAKSRPNFIINICGPFHWDKHLENLIQNKPTKTSPYLCNKKEADLTMGVNRKGSTPLIRQGP